MDPELEVTVDDAPRTCRCEADAATTAPHAAEPWLRPLRQLAYELTLAETRERRRLASELHDGLGQLLAIAQFRVGQLLQRHRDDDQGPDAALLRELRSLLAEAANATRSATFDLHSPLLQQLGLQSAIEGLADRVQRHGGPPVRIEGRLGSALPLPEAVQAVVLRVVRELLHNAYKHAGAASVCVRLACGEGALTIVVADDGIGCDLAALRDLAPRADGGFGLPSARAQLLAIGGRLGLRSEPGAGLVATLTVPLTPPRRRKERASATSASASTSASTATAPASPSPSPTLARRAAREGVPS